MEGTEKPVVYAFAAACILGIIIIGALVLTNHTTEEGFSELYFVNQDTLPDVVKIGDKLDFAFTTVSHEKNQTAYDYTVTYDGHDISSGSFSLEPSNSKTIYVSMTPKNTSQVKMTDPIVNQYKMKYNVTLGTILSKGTEFDRMMLLPSPNGTSLTLWGADKTTNKVEVNMPGKFIYPIRQQNADSFDLLIFDPKRKESYNSSVSIAIPEGGKEDGQLPSNMGYTIRRDDWNIVNDRGNIDIFHKTTSTIYRYAQKVVSVKVSTAGSEMRGAGESAKTAISDTRSGSDYEIHFGNIVTEDPDKLQNIASSRDLAIT